MTHLWKHGIPILGVLSFLTTGNWQSEAAPLTEPMTGKAVAALKLKASSPAPGQSIGSQLDLEVELVNTCERALDLRCQLPWTVVPEIWSASGSKKVPNAPSYIFSPVGSSEPVKLPPHRSIKLKALPIFVSDEAPSAMAAQLDEGQTRAFWYFARPGLYRLRYTLRMDDLLPGSGEFETVTSNDVPIMILARNAFDEKASK